MNRVVWLISIFLVKIFVLGSAAAQYTGQGSADPFSGLPDQPPQGAAAPGSANESTPLVLTGIIWVPGKPRAILNGKRVLEGETVAGATVIEIRKKEVKVRWNEQEIILKPQSGSTRSTSSGSW